MSLLGTHETAIRYSPLARKGYMYCLQIRERINDLRKMGIAPKAVWLGQDGYVAIRQCWEECLNNPNWDGVIPKWIAGVPCRKGSTGGQDYVVEWEDTEEARQAQQQSNFKAVDDPHGSIH